MKRKKIKIVKKKVSEIELLLSNSNPSSLIQVVVHFKSKDLTPDNSVVIAQKIMEATREEIKEVEKNLDIYPALHCMSVEASVRFIEILIQQKGIKQVSAGKGIAELHEQMVSEHSGKH